MKTSFYFILWIGIYFILGASRVPQLMEYSFFIAFILVMLLSRAASRLLFKQISYTAQLHLAKLMEMYYTDDVKRYRNIALKNFIFSFASLAYLAFATGFLIYAGEDIVMIGIFALITLGMGRQSFERWKAYDAARQLETLTPPDDNPQLQEAYIAYRHDRADHTPQEMVPRPSTADRIFRWANFGFAVASTLVGVAFVALYLPGLAGPKIVRLNSIMLMAYGGLAVIYGVNDMISTLRGE